MVEAHLSGQCDGCRDGRHRPPDAARAAGISKDTMLLGMGNHFELWDKASYEAQEAQAMQGQMPDVFKDFSF